MRPMLLDEHLEQLRHNGTDWEHDHPPVVKLYSVTGPETWLLSKVYPDDQDMAWGLIDNGLGNPEQGPVRISDLRRKRDDLGLEIRRDLHFVATRGLSLYTRAAQIAGEVVDRDWEIESIISEHERIQNHTP